MCDYKSKAYKFKNVYFFAILLLKIKHKRKIWSITTHRHVRCFEAFDIDLIESRW
jgi:hypothetical protein